MNAAAATPIQEPTTPVRSGSDILADLLAGLSLAGLLLPEAIAYSGIAGLPPQSGVWALLAGLCVYGWIGRGRTAAVAATSSSAAVLAAATASMGGGDITHRLALASGLVVLTGVFFLAAAAARLGEASAFIAKPVLRGFSFGLAVTIIVRQWSTFSGVAHASARVTTEAWHQISRIADWRPAPLLTGLCALVLLRALARLRRVPAALIVLCLGIALQQGPLAALVFHGGGLQTLGVPAVGPITLSPSVPELPTLPRETWLRLGELAFAMVFILYAESWTAIRGAALRRKEPVQANRELAALGACNLASAMFQGLPVGAGFSASAANEAAGATSRLAGFVAAGAVGAVVLWLLPLVSLTPEPVLAAIVIHAVGHTLSTRTFLPYFRWRRDRIVAVSAVVAVLWLGVLDGLLAAVGVSLLLYLRELSNPRVSELGRMDGGHDFLALEAHGMACRVPGLLILRPEAPLFFGNVERVTAAVLHEVRHSRDPVGRVVLSLEESPDLDGSCIEALGDLATALAGRGHPLLLARLKDPAREALVRADLPALPARALSALSVDEAVRAASADADADAEAEAEADPEGAR